MFTQDNAMAKLLGLLIVEMWLIALQQVGPFFFTALFYFFEVCCHLFVHIFIKDPTTAFLSDWGLAFDWAIAIICFGGFVLVILL